MYPSPQHGWRQDSGTGDDNDRDDDDEINQRSVTVENIWAYSSLSNNSFSVASGSSCFPGPFGTGPFFESSFPILPVAPFFASTFFAFAGIITIVQNVAVLSKHIYEEIKDTVENIDTSQ